MSVWSRAIGALGAGSARGKGAGFAAGIALVLAVGAAPAMAATAPPEQALISDAAGVAVPNKVLPTPNPPGSTASLLGAVSCPRAPAGSLCGPASGLPRGLTRLS
jgi:hypothetical protein